MTDKTDRKFQLGDRVTKTKGSNWTGRVVGLYSTDLTPVGYAVESETEKGSVQIYPESALRLMPDALPGQARPTFEGDEAEVREWLEYVAGNSLTSASPGLCAKALALLDAKDVKLAELGGAWEIIENMKAQGPELARMIARERDELRARAEQAEAALAAAGRAIEHNHEEYERLKEALAERDAAIVEAVRLLTDRADYQAPGR